MRSGQPPVSPRLPVLRPRTSHRGSLCPGGRGSPGRASVPPPGDSRLAKRASHRPNGRRAGAGVLGPPSCSAPRPPPTPHIKGRMKTVTARPRLSASPMMDGAGARPPRSLGSDLWWGAREARRGPRDGEAVCTALALRRSQPLICQGPDRGGAAASSLGRRGDREAQVRWRLDGRHPALLPAPSSLGSGCVLS